MTGTRRDRVAATSSVSDRRRWGLRIAVIAVVALALLDGYGRRCGGVQAAKLLDGMAAVVNDDMITISEVRETMGPEAEQLQQQYRGDALHERLTDLYQRALQQLIDVRLQLARARALNLQVDDEDVTRHIQTLQKQNEISDEQLEQMLKSRGLTLASYREQVREGLLIAKVVSAEVRSRLVVTDTELQAAYQEQREQYRIPGELTVSHILFLIDSDAASNGETRARQKAAMVLRQLRNGADFAALARRYSEGPSAERGGVLGTFRSGELLPAFEQAASKLRVGEISDIIQTRAGLHIIRVEDRQAGGYRPFADVQEAIKTELLESKTEQKYREWLASLRQGAYVKILYEGEGV